MKCTYCGNEIAKGTGTIYVYKIGNMSYFCSGRCYKFAIILKRKNTIKQHKKVVAATVEKIKEVPQKK